MSPPPGQSCIVSNCHVTINMPNQIRSGARDLFQTIFFVGMYFNFFLQGRKSKLDQITETIIIFKPKLKLKCLKSVMQHPKQDLFNKI